MQRSNNWLSEHHGIQIVSCETVTWSNLKVKNIFPDTCLYSQSLNAQKQTKYLRGLRSVSVRVCVYVCVSVFPEYERSETNQLPQGHQVSVCVCVCVCVCITRVWALRNKPSTSGASGQCVCVCITRVWALRNKPSTSWASGKSVWVCVSVYGARVWMLWNKPCTSGVLGQSICLCVCRSVFNRPSEDEDKHYWKMFPSILMKSLNVTLKCHGGQVTWWAGLSKVLFISHHVSTQRAVYY